MRLIPLMLCLLLGGCTVTTLVVDTQPDRAPAKAEKPEAPKPDPAR